MIIEVIIRATRATPERQRTVMISTILSPLMGEVRSGGSVGASGERAISAYTLAADNNNIISKNTAQNIFMLTTSNTPCLSYYNISLTYLQ